MLTSSLWQDLPMENEFLTVIISFQILLAVGLVSPSGLTVTNRALKKRNHARMMTVVSSVTVFGDGTCSQMNFIPLVPVFRIPGLYSLRTKPWSSRLKIIICVLIYSRLVFGSCLSSVSNGLSSVYTSSEQAIDRSWHDHNGRLCQRYHDRH